MRILATKKHALQLLCLGILTFSAQTFAAPPGLTTSKDNPGAVRPDIPGYWTAERMKYARPVPLPMAEGAPAKDLVLGKYSSMENANQSSGMEGDTPSALLNGDEADVMGMSGAIELQADDIEVLIHIPPHTTTIIPSAWYPFQPWRTMGKVFFSSGIFNYTCAGSSIGGRAVLTAGHCVSNGGGSWYSNWRFMPVNYPADRIWSASFLTTFTAWHTGGNLCRDVGFAITADQAGLKLSQQVGSLGFAWNNSPWQFYSMFGFGSSGLIMTQANTAELASPGGCSPFMKGIGYSQGGTGGGPWLLNYVPFFTGAANYANGVNSFSYVAHPNVIFSPHFDTAVNNFKAWAVAQ